MSSAERKITFRAAYNPLEAAEVLGMRSDFVRKEIREGELVAYRVVTRGGRRRHHVPLGALREYARMRPEHQDVYRRLC